ncbi:hypothetical protein HYU14_00760 [Candidatus Woesearchaeota archaeon]|nr:hypothetical protein [Candidatus Woesearchaeota archaeon]
MPESTLEDLKKLSAVERVRKLREFQEKSKREQEEADKLINQAEHEIETEELAGRVRIPEQKEVDITELFSREETQRPRLEAVAREEINERNVRYFVQEAYEGLKEAMQMGEEVSKAVLDELGEKLNRARKYFAKTDEDIRSIVATIGVAYKMRKEQHEES